MAISEADIEQALVAWGDGLVAISAAHQSDGPEAARTTASSVIDKLYGYDLGPVLFKPTMASGQQTFRPTKAGALSYFAAQDPDFPLDGGFGLKGWVGMRFETSASFIDGNVAMWMGWIIVTNADGDETTVDKSFGYRRDDAGTLRIVLHHSSFPYQP